jgi:hypothetical protein
MSLIAQLNDRLSARYRLEKEQRLATAIADPYRIERELGSRRLYYANSDGPRRGGRGAPAAK